MKTMKQIARLAGQARHLGGLRHNLRVMELADVDEYRFDGELDQMKGPWFTVGVSKATAEAVAALVQDDVEAQIAAIEAELRAAGVDPDGDA